VKATAASCLTAENFDVQMAVEFDLCWDAYPKRVNPLEAIACYRARRKEGVDFRTLYSAVIAYKEERKGEDAKFTMQGKVFFGTNHRWKDYDGKQTNGTRKRKDGKWEPPMKNLQELAKRDQAERDAKTPEAPTTDPSPTMESVEDRLKNL
jgi:hypothetical protein